jgi:hypothetical protein
MVVAPALILKRRSGERIKRNRREAVTLPRLHRACELTGCGCRARQMRPYAILCGLARRRLTIFGANAIGGHWTLAHRRWLAREEFEHVDDKAHIPRPS